MASSSSTTSIPDGQVPTAATLTLRLQQTNRNRLLQDLERVGPVDVEERPYVSASVF